MRILALITDAFGGYGGIALYNRDVLTALCAHPDIVEVVAIPRCIPCSMEPLPEKLDYRTKAADGRFSFFLVLLQALVNKNKFDLILCSHINLMPFAWLIKTIFQIPVVLEIYGIDAWKPPTGRLTAQKAVSAADAVICISSYTRDRFFSWSSLPKKVCTLLPNAIHLEQYGIAERSNKLIQRYGLAGKKVLLTLGRLVSHDRAKGFDEVLDLLPDLLKEVPELCYIIAGAGPYREALEAKARMLNVERHVVFTGMIKEEEKADIYRLADVYVMPSRGEGFGFVFLEAMACGVPVVASKVDGSRDAVRDGELGLLVDPDNPEEIKEAILASLSLPKQIPDGLHDFAFASFSRNLHELVNRVVKEAC